MAVNDLFKDTKEYDIYFGKVLQKVTEENLSINEMNPINELHLHPINDASLSIKMPSGYRMAFSTLLHTDGVSSYLIKRISKRNLPKGLIHHLSSIQLRF